MAGSRKIGQGLTLEQLKKRGSDYYYQLKESTKKPNPAFARKIPRTPSVEIVEEYCRTKIPGYDPWRDAEGYTFDPDRAREAIKWWHKHITHVKGRLGGTAFRLEPWQIAIIGNIWGWHADDTGFRRYRKMFFFVPQKNGKSILCAGLAVMFFVLDGEVGSETYCLAFTIKQANLVFTMARGIIMNDEWLSSQCAPHKYSIDKPEDPNAFFRTIAVEGEGVHGTNVHTGWVDELHTISIAKEDAILTLEEKTTAREQPFIGELTTAGYDKESLCFREYSYASNVRDGIDGFRDARLLPVIFEAKPEDDWTDEATWRKANPNYGISFSQDDMKRASQQAIRDPIRENKFRNLRLNQWTQQSVLWMKYDDWDACDQTPVELSDFEGRPCYAGFDYGQTNDLTALALVFPPSEPDGVFAVKCINWIPSEDAEARENQDKVPYRRWAKTGIVRITKGNVTDQNVIEADIVELTKSLSIKVIGYDKWHAEQLAIKLRDVYGMNLVIVPQTMAHLTGAAKLLQKLILSRRIQHGGDPCLRWQIGNVAAYEGPNEQIKLNKAGRSKRIDGVVAILDALCLYLLDADTGNVYDTDDVLTLDW